MSTTTGFYPWSYQQYDRLAKHPRISAKFALEKRLWDGRKVAVVSIERGNHRRKTQRHIYYGVLVLDAGDADQIGVRIAADDVRIVHKTRAVDIFDTTREKASQ